MKFPFRYFFSLLLMFAFFVLVLWLTAVYFPEWPRPAFAPLILAVIFVVTFTSHNLVRFAAIWKGKPFVQMVILSIVLRITLYALMALLIIIFSDTDPAVDMIYFAFFYLTVTIHEIVGALRNPIPDKAP